MNKNLYSIPASQPFADRLAEWIIDRYGADPLALPPVLVLLPSRRACLALREAFLRVTHGKPTLLLRMQPLGEVDEDRLLTLPLTGALGDAPHPAYGSKRLFMLAGLIRAYQRNVQGKTERMDHAVAQARDIADLLDKVEREGASLADLAQLVPDNFAAHWQLTTEFLSILAEHWPQIEAEQDMISPERWRNQSLRTLASAWEINPPDHPVIAAGTTGSIASTAALLKVISRMPQGSVILPGLDRQASAAYRDAITESHPQWGMRELLALLEVPLEDVQELIAPDAAGAARTSLLSKALAPAELLSEWRETAGQPEAVQGLHFLPCADQQEEAQTVSLMLRETLETPGKTAALVTHDRSLARRVSAEMLRYGVQIDDSAGRPLLETPAVAFFRLVVEMAESNAAPFKLLALLKHPYAHVGMERIACLEAARELELQLLRGLRPARGLQGLQEAAQKKNASEEVLQLLQALAEKAAPLLALFDKGGVVEFPEILEAHIACAEALAGEILWQGPEAETLVALIHELRDAGSAAELMEVTSYPALFDILFAGKVVRAEYGMHARLKILSPIEARMQSFDRMIIGGLNEGSWPPQVGAEPWFNRQMRAAIGLSVPERQIGQAAHDFTMLASAPEVFITRAEKIDGSPTSPARWWVRLMALLDHYGVREQLQPQHYREWVRALGHAGEVMPCPRPEFAPPLAARPGVIAVTQVEKWLSDPYAFYADKVLKLRALDPIDQDPTAANFGTTVHAALQHFVESHPEKLPPDAIDHLLQAGRKVFAEYHLYPVATAWWWPRFEQVAEWMIMREKQLRPLLAHVWAEVKGSFMLQGISFTGRADRIELDKLGNLAIVDYKTGGAHSKKETFEGKAVQLMLLALVAQNGGFEKPDITARPVSRLEYWIAGGGRNSGEIRPVDESQIAEYATQAKELLATLVTEYQNPQKAYVSSVSSGRYNDYEHLARMQEWR